jgi:DNA-binding MarR family transcriptional regulator
MSTGALDPQIHDPERLRAVATLAALPDDDALALTRLQGTLGLTPGSLITRLRELDHAEYVRTEKTGGDRAQAIVALTCDGRAGSLRRRAAAAARGNQGGSSGTSTLRARW